MTRVREIKSEQGDGWHVLRTQRNMFARIVNSKRGGGALGFSCSHTCAFPPSPPPPTWSHLVLPCRIVLLRAFVYMHDDFCFVCVCVYYVNSKHNIMCKKSSIFIIIFGQWYSDGKCIDAKSERPQNQLIGNLSLGSGDWKDTDKIQQKFVRSLPVVVSPFFSSHIVPLYMSNAYCIAEVFINEGVVIVSAFYSNQVSVQNCVISVKSIEEVQLISFANVLSSKR